MNSWIVVQLLLKETEIVVQITVYGWAFCWICPSSNWIGKSAIGLVELVSAKKPTPLLTTDLIINVKLENKWFTDSEA